MTDYLLTRESWLLVTRMDGTRGLESLIGLFDHAARIRTLDGDTMMQRFALHRLVFAVVGAAARDRVTPQTYLTRWESRFNLLDSSYPFMQSADLTSTTGRNSGLSKIMSAVAPKNDRAFTSRYGRCDGEGLPAGFTLDYATAARWLVCEQAATVAGIKTLCEGDEGRNGKRYGSPCGPCAVSTMLMAEGATLADTLALNTPDPKPGDRPCWERDDPPFPRRDGTPDGVLDALTWQSCRIRLIHDGARVTDALVTAGDTWKPGDTSRLDPMIVLRRRKDGHIVPVMDVEPWLLLSDPTVIPLRDSWGDRVSACRYDMNDKRVVIDAERSAVADTARIGEWTEANRGTVRMIRGKLVAWHQRMRRTAGLDDKTMLDTLADRDRTRFDRLCAARVDRGEPVVDAARRTALLLLDQWETGMPSRARYQGFTSGGLRHTINTLMEGEHQ